MQTFWSLPFVSGKRFGTNKPVYILTSRNTCSGAEEFAYSLQAIKRVKIVGDRTRGGANPGSVKSYCNTLARTRNQDERSYWRISKKY
ncbi:S41 family peptidase [Paenibacillus plantarum]